MTDWFFIKTNVDLCTGCSLCQLACSLRWLGGYNPHRALLNIEHARENFFPVADLTWRKAWSMPLPQWLKPVWGWFI